MAPNIKLQTESVVSCLLYDFDDPKSNRSYGTVESDGPGDPDFDPVLVADRLRTVGDTLNKNSDFIDALKTVAKDVTREVVATEFEKGVETLCASYVSKDADVAQELHLINAAVALGLYLNKNSPDLKEKVKNAMTSFLNSRVSTWVAQQGGWDKVPVSK